MISSLGGAAQARGSWWAIRVARQRRDLLAQPWPAHEGRAAELAAKHVDDLSRDPRVIEQFARLATVGAAREWAQLQQLAPARLEQMPAPPRERRRRR